VFDRMPLEFPVARERRRGVTASQCMRLFPRAKGGVGCCWRRNVRFPVRVAGWSAWPAQGLDEEVAERIPGNTITVHPNGSPWFVAQLEPLLGRALRPLKRGRKPNGKEGSKTEKLGIE